MSLCAWRDETKAPPLKGVKDGAPEVQRINYKYEISHIELHCVGDNAVEWIRLSHPSRIIF
jgi:hypothetical protein